MTYQSDDQVLNAEILETLKEISETTKKIAEIFAEFMEQETGLPVSFFDESILDEDD